MTDYETKLARTVTQWQKCDPKAMAKMSEAAIMYALSDAKDDVLRMHAEIKKLRLDLNKLAARSLATNDVLAERQRQVEKEGWTPEHDDEHKTGAMAAAAACYALWASAPSAENAYWHAAREEAARMLWPWDREWWKPSEDSRRNLVKAGALILAEIERLDRAAK